MGKRGRGETEMTRGGNSEKEHSKDNKDENKNLPGKMAEIDF